ncbi:hypothetical protein E4U57_007380 [Claviceps arundinis]|uniref:Uncharacterized protein n=1 Tax=Claviceps arundinis TaxID=1623583 RepID=A0A9P7MLP3_9HYPO|nr:hypothetical protein E4U57_007380 [Claviceps arundinis]KAG5956001.1 hypothetical protein E4U56_006788 [Claviceps arundinis]
MSQVSDCVREVHAKSSVKSVKRDNDDDGSNTDNPHSFVQFIPRLSMVLWQLLKFMQASRATRIDLSPAGGSEPRDGLASQLFFRTSKDEASHENEPIAEHEENLTQNCL